jgi:type III secretion system YscQ/HrcQ family protein
VTELHTVDTARLPVAPSPRSSLTSLRSLLPQLNGRSITWRNRVYSTPACQLRDGRVLIWQASDHCNPAGELHCKLGGSPVTLAADNLCALEPRLQGFESFVPSQACTTLVEHALASVLDLIESLAGQSMACEEFRRIEPRSSPGDAAENALLRIGFVLLGRNSQPEVRGWVRASPPLWNSLDLSRAPAVPTQRCQSILLSLSVRLGRCRLPLTEVRDLKVGDALRSTPRLACHGGVHVQLVHAGGRFGWRARTAGDQLILEAQMNNIMDTPTPTHTTTETAAPGARLSDEEFLSSVECELSFELGSTRMSVAEIAKLRAGHVLHPGVRLHEQPVRILANGRQIARGELAAVGDELVVVVTQTSGLPNI